MDTKEMKFYSPDDIASMLKVSRRTIYNYMRDGKLPAVKIGGYCWRISQDGLNQFLQEKAPN